MLIFAKFTTAFAAFSAMTSVILGAFAAHGLKGKLSESALAAFQTGVQYQMIHALALLYIGLLMRQQMNNLLLYVAGAMVLGTLLFSGSLYGLALTSARWLGPITPLGGMCFIIGWFLLFLFALRS